MKLLLDTNIFIDILLDRKPFSKDSVLVYKMCENGLAQGYVAPITINNIYYICRKSRNPSLIKAFLSKISEDFTIAPMDGKTIEKANRLPISDYEDALQYAMALQNSIDCLITRNVKDFKKMSFLRVYTPEELMEDIG